MAFLSGLMANGIYVATTRAFNPVQENSIASERNGTSSVPTTRTHLVQPGGGKGAGIGALSGGIAGLVYNLATRNK